jgi:hypothetical protein
VCRVCVCVCVCVCVQVDRSVRVDGSESVCEYVVVVVVAYE